MRTVALALLMLGLAAGPGCVTLLTQEQLNKATPITEFDPPQRAWIQTTAEGERVLTLAVPEHTTYAKPAFGCVMQPRLGPARLVYKLEDGADRLEVDRFSPVPTTRFAETPAAREIPVVAADAAPVARGETIRTFVRYPAVLVTPEGTCELELRQDARGPKAAAARVAKLATLPLTVPVDMALSPIYGIVIVVLVARDALD